MPETLPPATAAARSASTLDQQRLCALLINTEAELDLVPALMQGEVGHVGRGLAGGGRATEWVKDRVGRGSILFFKCVHVHGLGGCSGCASRVVLLCYRSKIAVRSVHPLCCFGCAAEVQRPQ